MFEMIKHLTSIPPLTVVVSVESIETLQEIRVDLIDVFVVGAIQ